LTFGCCRFRTFIEFLDSENGYGRPIFAGFWLYVRWRIGSLIIIIDINFNWANVEAFVEPVPTYSFDAGVGHNFVNARRADCSVTIWFGGFYQKIKADTDGHIPISSLFRDITPEAADEIREGLDQWVERLSPGQEIIMREVIQKINDYLKAGSQETPKYTTCLMNG